jgi:hypothetical protein
MGIDTFLGGRIGDGGDVDNHNHDSNNNRHINFM